MLNNINIDKCEFSEKIHNCYWCNLYKIRNCELTKCLENDCYYKQSELKSKKILELETKLTKILEIISNDFKENKNGK